MYLRGLNSARVSRAVVPLIEHHVRSNTAPAFDGPRQRNGYTARQEHLTPSASVLGVLPSATVTMTTLRWHDTAVLQFTYRDADGNLGEELLYRD